MPQSLSFIYYESSAIPEPILRETWQLRINLLTLTKSEEDDWAFYKKWVTLENAALLTFSDKTGKIQGFLIIRQT